MKILLASQSRMKRGHDSLLRAWRIVALDGWIIGQADLGRLKNET